MPETMTWPIIAPVIVTFMRAAAPEPFPLDAPAVRSALVPGRRREARLGGGELVRPHRHLLAFTPLEQDHLVRDLESVLIDLVFAEHRAGLELEQRLAHAIGIERAGALDAFRVDDAAGVAGSRVIRRIVTEVLPVGVHELLDSGIRQRRLPLR